jgi:hypothetical protein
MVLGLLEIKQQNQPHHRFQSALFNIPFFSPIRRLSEPEAIIPLFHRLYGSYNQHSGAESKPGPPGRDSLL